MKKTLLVIDMQNDFIDMALGTKEAVEIVPYVKERIEVYYEQTEKFKEMVKQDPEIFVVIDTPEKFVCNYNDRELLSSNGAVVLSFNMNMRYEYMSEEMANIVIQNGKEYVNHHIKWDKELRETEKLEEMKKDFV